MDWVIELTRMAAAFSAMGLLIWIIARDWDKPSAEAFKRLQRDYEGMRRAHSAVSNSRAEWRQLCQESGKQCAELSEELIKLAGEYQELDSVNTINKDAVTRLADEVADLERKYKGEQEYADQWTEKATVLEVGVNQLAELFKNGNHWPAFKQALKNLARLAEGKAVSPQDVIQRAVEQQVANVVREGGEDARAREAGSAQE